MSNKVSRFNSHMVNGDDKVEDVVQSTLFFLNQYLKIRKEKSNLPNRLNKVAARIIYKKILFRKLKNIYFFYMKM